MFQSEQLEAYLRNELSAEETRQLEDMLQRDPLLQNELNLQKDIVQVIQEQRHSQLKARLNHIDTDTATVPGEGFRVAGWALAGLLTLGIGGFLAYEQFKPGEIVKPVVTENQAPVRKQPVPETQIDQREVPVIQSNSQKKEALVVKKQTAKKQVDKPVTELVPPISANPDDSQPEDGSIQKDPQFSMPSGDITPTGNKDRQGVKVSVVSEKGGKYSFHYSYTEGKLFLYGDFSQLYEILEFNPEAGKQVYLFYQENFYRLKENQTAIVPLQPVKDPQLIKTLQEAREKNLQK
jgi:hypothetical protein